MFTKKRTSVKSKKNRHSWLDQESRGFYLITKGTETSTISGSRIKSGMTKKSQNDNSMKLDDAIKRLRKFYRFEKRLPTYEEMTELFGFSSKNASFKLIAKLIEAGILEKGDKGKLLPKNLFAIPHLGTIKAGYPMPAFEAHHDNIDLFRYLYDVQGEIYFLTVSGDSMIDALIGEGDKIIVDPNRTAKNGDIVAAIVDNEWTVKYYYKRNGVVELIPANKNYPVIYPKESLEIGGVVISVIRKYH